MGDLRPKTIICDIDGVLFKHTGSITNIHLVKPMILNNVIETISDWDLKGYTIILVTGRRESTRKYTEKQLAEAGIIYDHLIMGVPGGVRILINDRKPNSAENTAFVVNLDRNVGFSKDILKEI